MTIPFILSAASLCIVILSFFYFRRYIARKTSAREMLADYRAAVHSLIAQIDAATDRDALLIEEQIKTLKKIIEDTDRRISVYMKELQRSRNGEALYSSLGRGIRAALDSRAPPQLELPLEDTKKREENKKDPETVPQEAPARKRGGKKPKLRVQIAAMAAQGVPPDKIASRLKLSIAEVDLALNLLRRTGGEEPHE